MRNPELAVAVTAPRPRRGLRATLLAAAALVLLTAAGFSGVLRNGFVNFDDDAYLTANPHVARGLTAEALKWAFTTTRTGNWHPLTWVSHLVDVQLFGLQPAGHHGTALALHAANVLLLFLLTAALTGKIWRGALVAALFAVHPLHVESVAWAAERKDLLSTLLALLAALAWVRHLHHPARAWRAAAWCSFALALLAKPMPVTLPFLLLVLDWWPLGRWRPAAGHVLPPARLLTEKLPFFALAFASGVVTFVVQRGAGAMEYGAALSLPMRLANAACAYLGYLQKMLVPVGLTVFYPLAPFAPWAKLLLCGGAVLGLLAAAVRLAGRRPWLLAGGLWYLGTLVPVIGLVQVGGQALADRYTYLPLTGVFLALCWEAALIVRGRPRLRAWVAPCAAALLLALTALTRQQVGLWRDDLTLYRHTLRWTEGNWFVHNHLGVAYARLGRNEEAMHHYSEALRLGGERPRILGNYAALLSGAGRSAEAAAIYERILAADPRAAEAQHNLGAILLERGDAAAARERFAAAVALEPDWPQARTGLGNAQLALGDLAGASASYRAALALEERTPATHFNLALALLRASRPREAVEHLARTAQLDPADLAARVVLGDSLLLIGEARAAEDAYLEALRLSPGLPAATAGLARARARAQQGAAPLAGDSSR